MSTTAIVVLGSTGSIGVQTLEVVRAHPGRFRVLALAGGSNVDLLEVQAREFKPEVVAVGRPERGRALAGSLSDTGIRVVSGPAGLEAAAALPAAELVVGGISGIAGLRPLLAALGAGKRVALANKEPLVAAGALVTAWAQEHGGELIPVDSELSAIFQCLKGEDRAHLARIFLTASGGPFARLTKEQLARVTPEQALEHPTWRMGRKVTIDSATLMNKGFEVFETRWLFGVEWDRIRILVHHQSIIHSMVEFVDGSCVAQLGLPDMRFPIQYALFYPERAANDLPRLDLAERRQLTFDAPDLERFPCLRLAFEAGRLGQTYPAALNAADEIAVEAFLDRRIGFMDIPRVIEQTLSAHDPLEGSTLEQLEEVDDAARRSAAAVIAQT